MSNLELELYCGTAVEVLQLFLSITLDLYWTLIIIVSTFDVTSEETNTVHSMVRIKEFYDSICWINQISLDRISVVLMSGWLPIWHLSKTDCRDEISRSDDDDWSDKVDVSSKQSSTECSWMANALTNNLQLLHHFISGCFSAQSKPWQHRISSMSMGVFRIDSRMRHTAWMSLLTLFVAQIRLINQSDWLIVWLLDCLINQLLGGSLHGTKALNVHLNISFHSRDLSPSLINLLSGQRRIAWQLV